MSERDEVTAIANRVLDTPYIDPDGDICVLARQLLRERERTQYAANLLTNLAQIVDVVRQEWGESWSAWDQEQREGITKFLTWVGSGKGSEGQ